MKCLRVSSSWSGNTSISCEELEVLYLVLHASPYLKDVRSQQVQVLLSGV